MRGVAPAMLCFSGASLAGVFGCCESNRRRRFISGSDAFLGARGSSFCSEEVSGGRGRAFKSEACSEPLGEPRVEAGAGTSAKGLSMSSAAVGAGTSGATTEGGEGGGH